MVDVSELDNELEGTAIKNILFQTQHQHLEILVIDPAECGLLIHLGGCSVLASSADLDVLSIICY